MQACKRSKLSPVAVAIGEVGLTIATTSCTATVKEWLCPEDSSPFAKALEKINVQIQNEQMIKKTRTKMIDKGVFSFITLILYDIPHKKSTPNADFG